MIIPKETLLLSLFATVLAITTSTVLSFEDCKPYITYKLWNADKNVVIGNLPRKIDLCNYGDAGLTIEAAMSSDCVTSVNFSLESSKGRIVHTKYERQYRYMMGGNINRPFDVYPVPQLSVPGKYQLIVEPNPAKKEIIPLNIVRCQSQVELYNTFADPGLTGGQEELALYFGPEPIKNRIEFDLGTLVANDQGLYLVDVREDGVEFTLINNAGVLSLVVADGRYDIYYFRLSFRVTNAFLTGLKSRIAQFTTVEVAPPGYTLDVPNLYPDGNIETPVDFPNGAVIVSMGPGTDFSILDQVVEVVFDPDVMLVNTFIDPGLTAGKEEAAVQAGPVPIHNGIEFDLSRLVANDQGLYKIDVGTDLITFTLVDNKGLIDLVVADGRYDIYYFSLPFDVDSAYILEPRSDVGRFTTVELIRKNFHLNVPNLYPGGEIKMPIKFPNGGIKVTMGPGADFTRLYQKINIALNPGVEVINTFIDSVYTSGEEQITQYFGPVLLGRGSEFDLATLVPADQGLYMIDVTPSLIKFTLKKNSGVLSLVAADGRYDIYYFRLSFDVNNAYLLNPLSKIAQHTTVELVPRGFGLDVPNFYPDSNIALPVVFPGGGVKVTVGPGADFTNLGQEINVRLA